MAWNKLPYVKTTPALALPRLLPLTQDINIWDTGGGQFNLSTSVVEYNGIRFGEVEYVPTDMGYMYAPNILSVTGPDKDNYYIGALSEMHSVTMPFDATKDVYMVLLEWHAIELGPTPIRSIFFCSALDTGGGDGSVEDTMEGLENLKGYGITPVIDEIHAIFKVANPVGAYTANMPISYFYERFNPVQGTWINNFGGTAGFGIDIFDYPDANLKWKTSHGIADGSDSFSEASSSHGTANILVDQQWTVEFDYDLTNCISSTDWDEISSPDQPHGIFSPLAVLSRQIGFVVVANNNGTYRSVPIAWGDGPPAVPIQTVPGAARVRINHDGLQNYDYYVSDDHGVTWTPLWIGVVGDKLNIPGYETAEKWTSFRGIALIASDTLNVRWTGIDFRTYSVTPAFEPLQSGEYPVNIQGYLTDKLGFTDGINNYIGFNGADASFEGSNTGSIIAGPIPIFDEVRYPGQAGYRLDLGDIYHFTGTEDAYAMAVWVNIAAVDYYITFAIGDSQRVPFINEIVGLGGTAVEIGKIFTNGGAGNDYVWSWTPPTPPTPTPSSAAIAMDMIDREMIDDVLMEDM